MDWLKQSKVLTPVEKIGDFYFKREDKFSPMGYGNINGSKLRQCIYMIDRYGRQQGKSFVASGSVSGSPQHPFVTAVARYFGMGSLIVTAVIDRSKYRYLQMAEDMGATFVQSRVPYAKALGGQARKIAEKNPDQAYWLETNITLSTQYHGSQEIADFHEVGGLQVKNIPEEVTTLIIPFGSTISATSVLYGLWKHGHKNVNRILLMAIGNYGSYNSKTIIERLRYASPRGEDISKLYNYSLPGIAGHDDGVIDIERHDINGSGFAKYEDMMIEHYEGINFHPRYEGKVWRYLHAHPEIMATLPEGKTLFWIVGSEIK